MQACEGRIVPDASDRAVAAELVALQRASYAVEAELIGFDQIPGLRESVEELVAAGLLWLGVREGGRLAGALAYRRLAGCCRHLASVSRTSPAGTRLATPAVREGSPPGCVLRRRLHGAPMGLPDGRGSPIGRRGDELVRRPDQVEPCRPPA
jgi:hypothetical protein